MTEKKKVTVKDVSEAIEKFAPRQLQESYDNAGLQVGIPNEVVTAVLICLDVNEEVIAEAKERGCNLIVSHHPLIFRGIKSLTGKGVVERSLIEAVKNDISVYSAHTNLDSAREGVSHEMARKLHLSDINVLEPKESDPKTGLGVIGNLDPTPKIEFLRKIKEAFGVKALKYSAQSSALVIRRVAVCGGAGADLIREAVNSGADIMVTGDVKYHDYTTYGPEILIADIGHYESELCSREILARIIRENFPDIVIYLSESETNPIKIL